MPAKLNICTFALLMSFSAAGSIGCALSDDASAPASTDSKKRDIGDPKNLRPGDVFKDCADCPEMFVIPKGKFRMGDSSGGTNDWEKPVHKVVFSYQFAVGKFEVTRGEYKAFVLATSDKWQGGCQHRTKERWAYNTSMDWSGLSYRQSDRHPVVCINWEVAKAYVEWLRLRTGREYRLLSGSEWEYVARAGTATKFYFGNEIRELCEHENGADLRAKFFTFRNKSCDDGFGNRTSPVGGYPSNPFGVHDMLGNVSEWVEDIWQESFAGAPTDGSAWTKPEEWDRRVIRGGDWTSSPMDMRASVRGRNDVLSTYDHTGFRVAVTLP